MVDFPECNARLNGRGKTEVGRLMEQYIDGV